MHCIHLCTQIASYVNMFAFTGTNFCDLVTSGETDPMDKHHAADCQDPEDAARYLGSFWWQQGERGVNTITEFSQDERVSGLSGCEL